MENSSPVIGSKKDYIFGVVSGFLIGVLLLPILQTTKPTLFESLKFIIIPLFVVLVPIGLVIASWLARKIAILWELSKFIVIGILNTLVDLGALAFIQHASTQSTLPIAPEDILFVTFFGTLTYFTFYKSITFIIANINSFFWNKYWTFKTADSKKSSTEFAQFFIVSFIGFLINVTTASLIFKFFHLLGGLTANQWGLIGAAAGSISGLAWNFIGYKFIVFKKTDTEAN